MVNFGSHRVCQGSSFQNFKSYSKRMVFITCITPLSLLVSFKLIPRHSISWQEYCGYINHATRINYTKFTRSRTGRIDVSWTVRVLKSIHITVYTSVGLNWPDELNIASKLEGCQHAVGYYLVKHPSALAENRITNPPRSFVPEPLSSIYSNALFSPY